MDEYSKEVNDIFENMKVELERMKKDEVSQIEIKEEMDQKIRKTINGNNNAGHSRTIC